MALLPANPAERRLVLSQCLGFIVLPVVAMLAFITIMLWKGL